jgi:hypothetical protein
MTEKCEIAMALASGVLRGGYAEAAILICAALSALAAEVWPGRGIDRVRFIELLVRFAPDASVPTRISIPLLVRDLSLAGSDVSAKQLGNEFLNFGETRVVIGSETDKPESEVLAISPTVPLKLVRQFSYACLLYQDVRSAYAHEYQPGARADSWPMTMSRSEAVSYVNRLVGPGEAATVRLIHFHIAWWAELAIGIAKSIDAQSRAVPRSPPLNWWIDGSS